MRRMVKRESTFSNWQVYGPITEALRDGQREHRANFLKQPGGGGPFRRNANRSGGPTQRYRAGLANAGVPLILFAEADRSNRSG